jgi:hypothetical protein
MFISDLPCWLPLCWSLAISILLPYLAYFTKVTEPFKGSDYWSSFITPFDNHKFHLVDELDQVWHAEVSAHSLNPFWAWSRSSQLALCCRVIKCFSPLSDPLVFRVFYLPKYFGNFINFISHAKSIYLKNISCDCGNTRARRHEHMLVHLYGH